MANDLVFNTSKIRFSNSPYNHWIFDDFLDNEIALNLSKEFIDYKNNSDEIIHYHDSNAEKKTCNSWNRFPQLTYQTFHDLLSVQFISNLSEITGITHLYPDIGLHGGGWHIHNKNGRLGIHLDYSIHPKLNLQRKLNLIIYLEHGYKSEWGGSLQLWSHDHKLNKPLHKVKEIKPTFNTAILFDTTQNSWHGFPDPINPPEGKARKSLAVYYLTDRTSIAVKRYRAEFTTIRKKKS